METIKTRYKMRQGKNIFGNGIHNSVTVFVSLFGYGEQVKIKYKKLYFTHNMY